MCQVEKNQVIAVHNVSTTYHVPLLLHEQKLLSTISGLLGLDAVKTPAARIEEGGHMWKNWVDLTKAQAHTSDTVKIALVGKYTSLHDAYISVSKAFEHAAMYCRKTLELVWVDAGQLEDKAKETSPEEFDKAWDAVHTADGSKQ
jgi:CTP synthase